MRPRLVDGALLGRERMGSGGVSASGGRFFNLLYVVSNTAVVSVTAIAHDANKLCKYWADQRDPPIKQTGSPCVFPLHPFVPR